MIYSVSLGSRKYSPHNNQTKKKENHKTCAKKRKNGAKTVRFYVNLWMSICHCTCPPQAFVSETFYVTTKNLVFIFDETCCSHCCFSVLKHIYVYFCVHCFISSILLLEVKQEIKILLTCPLATPENKWLFFILYCVKYQTSKHLLKRVFRISSCKTQSR